MNIVALQEIVKQANLRAIKKALKAADFVDCKHDKLLRRVSLYDIATAPQEETPDFPDGKGNEYNGILCREVKGYEQYEFAIVQLLAPFKRGCEDLSTKKMLIYSKKSPNNI